MWIWFIRFQYLHIFHNTPLYFFFFFQNELSKTDLWVYHGNSIVVSAVLIIWPSANIPKSLFSKNFIWSPFSFISSRLLDRGWDSYILDSNTYEIYRRQTDRSTKNDSASAETHISTLHMVLCHAMDRVFSKWILLDIPNIWVRSPFRLLQFIVLNKLSSLYKDLNLTNI
jgi:hypothetical protein